MVAVGRPIYTHSVSPKLLICSIVSSSSPPTESRQPTPQMATASSMHILSLQSCLFVLLFCLHLHQQSLVNQHLRWPPLGHSYCVSSITKSNSTGSCSDCRLIN
ncbi:hypothetical protein QL285_043152 [Trifolium repens]|nr:hypothetical protein QL285_043152 [Trifolium repens]